MINGFHHASLIVSDTAVSVDFYTNLLGLEVAAGRPDLGYPGAWLNIGDMQIHLLELPNPDPQTGRPEHGGRDRHLAFDVGDLDNLIQKFDQSQTAYSLSRSGRRALFCRDPDGNALEFIESATR